MGGIAATLADVFTLKLLVKHAVASIPVSAFIAASVGAIVCFFFNKHLAFRDKNPVTFEQVARFGFVAFVTGVLTAGAMKIVAVDLQVPLLLAKAICAATIFVAWTFPAQRRLVFKPVAA